ncbi:DUF1919 domain-containing protein [Butyrivibrio sp. AE2032]|uniref:DUF1919 domain-containing protein n=1 Tax=Butyrivibrio sp. AE2032 TaxID=1458463 RepID=UPI000550599E|nr:DUF1919 domain-containing protein [Butyrivibrio sp. AE2032]
MIEDLSVVFVHDKDMQSVVRHWNACRKLVDYDNLAFVMEDCGKYPVTDLLAREFCELHIKHLLVLRNRIYSGCDGVITVNHYHFHERGMAVEEWFDLLEWINS